MERDTDFDFGANAPDTGSIADDLSACLGLVVCKRCGQEHGRCDDVRARVPKEKYGMDVGSYVKSGAGERNEFITAKEVGKGIKVKILSANPVTTPKFSGLIMNFKLPNGKKRAYGVRFDGYDLAAIVAQTNSSDTDDWLGMTLALVTKKGAKGGTFVNVAQKGRKK